MSLPKAVQDQVVKLFTNTFLGKATKLLGKRAKVLGFLGFVTSRFAEVGTKEGLASFQGMIRMVKASSRGEYPNLPWRTAVSVIGGLLYLASPIDIIPDFIPLLGFLDDAFLLGKIFSLAERDLRDFLDWEAAGSLPKVPTVQA